MLLGRGLSFVVHVLLIIPFFSYGQQSVVVGTVRNTDNSVIQGATVRIVDPESRAIKVFGRTDTEGKFRLQVNPSGTFLLIVSSLSHIPDSSDLMLTDQGTKIDREIVLTPQVVKIQEVVVSSRPPITQKKDTTSFDAAYFAQGNERVVEDLLKKIPGVDVAGDGTISVGGREVEKVMIDGDDFFERGYKILTKTMPPQPIDQVQVLERYSNNTLLKDIEDSDRVALNLTLKENAQNVWFGSLSHEQEIEQFNRFDSRFNVMNFSRNAKYYFTGKANNVGNSDLNDIANLLRASRSGEPAAVGDDQHVTPFMAMGLGEVDGIDRFRYHFNNNQMASLNAIHTFSPKVKLTSSAFLNADRLNFYEERTQFFSIQGDSFVNVEDSHRTRDIVDAVGRIDLSYTPTTDKSVVYLAKFNTSFLHSGNHIVFNDDPTNETVATNSVQLDQKVVYTHKQSENSVLLLSARHKHDNFPQDYALNRFLYQDLFVTGGRRVDNVRQDLTNGTDYFGVEAHWMKRHWNHNLLEIRVGGQVRSDDLFSSFSLFEGASLVDRPTGYQQDIRYRTWDMFFKSRYQVSWNQFDFVGQMDAHKLDNALQSVDSGDQLQIVYVVNPNLNLRWTPNERNRVSGRYSFATRDAGLTDLYPNFLHLGLRNFNRGSGEFTQLDMTNATLSYRYSGYRDRFIANFVLGYNKDHDFFTNRMIIAQNYQLNERILIKDRVMRSFRGNLEQFVTPLKTNFKVSVGLHDSEYQNMVNSSELRDVRSTTQQYKLLVQSGFDGVVNYSLGSDWTRNAVITEGFRSHIQSNYSFASLNLSGLKWSFDTDWSRHHFTNAASEYNVYQFLDARGMYHLERKKITFHLAARNILNTTSFRSFVVDDISTMEMSVRLLPRILTVGLEFRF